jgi:hypothetical protein
MEIFSNAGRESRQDQRQGIMGHKTDCGTLGSEKGSIRWRGGQAEECGGTTESGEEGRRPAADRLVP